jgi:hypothetical protein
LDVLEFAKVFSLCCIPLPVGKTGGFADFFVPADPTYVSKSAIQKKIAPVAQKQITKKHHW